MLDPLPIGGPGPGPGPVGPVGKAALLNSPNGTTKITLLGLSNIYIDISSSYIRPSRSQL